MTVAKTIVTNAVKEASFSFSDSSPSATGNPQDLSWELQVKTSGILFLRSLTCHRYGQHNCCQMHLHGVEQSKHGN